MIGSRLHAGGCSPNQSIPGRVLRQTYHVCDALHQLKSESIYTRKGIKTLSGSMIRTTKLRPLRPNQSIPGRVLRLFSDNFHRVYLHLSESIHTRKGIKTLDGQGSTRALSDDSGAVTDAYAYTAYEEPYSQSGSSENSDQYAG